MPHYQIHHSISISPKQQAVLAQAITKIHCDTFSAASIFVNVTFYPASDSTTYVGGFPEPQKTNYIHAHIRPRGERYRWKLTELVEQITDAWVHILGNCNGTRGSMEKWEHGRLDDPLALHNIFVMEDITAGAEQGFMLPAAGKDEGWLEENKRDFVKRAEARDESMQRFLQELKEKEEK